MPNTAWLFQILYVPSKVGDYTKILDVAELNIECLKIQRPGHDVGPLSYIISFGGRGSQFHCSLIFIRQAHEFLSFVFSILHNYYIPMSAYRVLSDDGSEVGCEKLFTVETL